MRGCGGHEYLTANTSNDVIINYLNKIQIKSLIKGGLKF